MYGSGLDRNVGKLEAEKCVPLVLFLFFAHGIDCVCAGSFVGSQGGRRGGGEMQHTAWEFHSSRAPRAARAREIFVGAPQRSRFMGFKKWSVNEPRRNLGRSRNSPRRTVSPLIGRDSDERQQTNMLIRDRPAVSHTNGDESSNSARIQVEKSAAEPESPFIAFRLSTVRNALSKLE